MEVDNDVFDLWQRKGISPRGIYGVTNAVKQGFLC